MYYHPPSRHDEEDHHHDDHHLHLFGHQFCGISGGGAGGDLSAAGGWFLRKPLGSGIDTNELILYSVVWLWFFFPELEMFLVFCYQPKKLFAEWLYDLELY